MSRTNEHTEPFRAGHNATGLVIAGVVCMVVGGSAGAVVGVCLWVCAGLVMEGVIREKKGA